LIDEALLPQSEKATKDRIAKAESNTWTARISQFWDIMKPYL